MDRNSDHLLNEGLLREALCQRMDGRWAFLAAAAGRPDAIEELSLPLSRAELDRGSAGRALTPSLVSERVEALAVSASLNLTHLAKEWRMPIDTGDDPFWAAAWNSALRHLVGRVCLNPDDFRLPAVAVEAALVWPRDHRPSCSWDEVAAACVARTVPYNEIRRWATYRLVDRHIQESQLRHVPILFLRVLRGHYEVLTADAIDYLYTRCEDLLGQDSFETAVLAEALSAVDASIMSTLQRWFLDILPDVTEPRDVIPLAYFLLEPRWVVP
jgi:hypothetical protein